ncbi:hypothetical protein [Nocardiopsis composta]|uniref:Lipoprotein n=1 Tax=Nocardiopsis composta TaxID=157465 RepID=A0A7W8QLA3_9ACTN|nr:hypothetical protein [Nocardiopsis composta]MBB5432380.1 hypothetical protein [Nocardiopsis composta]
MTGRPVPTALAVLAALGAPAALAGCAPDSPPPVAEGHPLALAPPGGWEERPVPDGEAEQADPVLYTARPGDGGDASLVVQAFPGQVSAIETGTAIAEAGREARWRDYRSGPPDEASVPGADEARRIDYTYACDDSGGDCAGAVFVLLRERDLYLVRMSWRDGLVSADEVDAVQESLTLDD